MAPRVAAIQRVVAQCATTSVPAVSPSPAVRLASTSSSSSSSSSTDIRKAQRKPTKQNRAPLPPSQMRSRVSSRDVQLTTNYQRPKTNWNSPLHRDAVPMADDYPISSPLPSSAEKAGSRSPNIAIGPGASNQTSLQWAERSLHLRLQPGRLKGPLVGQPGTRYGVEFERDEALRATGATEGKGSQPLGDEIKARRKQLYLERRGGDYSRFLSSNVGATELDEEDWEANASHALSFHSELTPNTRQRFLDQVNTILEGEPFRAPAAPAEEKKPAGRAAQAAPAAVKGKGKKK